MSDRKFLIVLSTGIIGLIGLIAAILCLVGLASPIFVSGEIGERRDETAYLIVGAVIAFLIFLSSVVVVYLNFRSHLRNSLAVER